MAYNVPVVNDGLPARIRACEARPGLANCGGVRRGNGAKRNDLAERSPSRRKAAKRLQSCYVPVAPLIFLNNFIS